MKGPRPAAYSAENVRERTILTGRASRHSSRLRTAMSVISSGPGSGNPTCSVRRDGAL